jgi:serine/threonine protein kinase
MELSQEIEILKRVRHPNIIQFHDYWYNNTEFVFITELMTSGTLREYIKKLQIPNIRIVKRWARQILKGLSYLHSHDPPIIHRDIKVMYHLYEKKGGLIVLVFARYSLFFDLEV